MTSFSQRVNGIPPSGIREVFAGASGEAINLGLGEPDFQAPNHIHRAAIDAIQNGDADGYTSNRGLHDLREAICEKHARENGFDLDPENVIVTAGASEALHLAIDAHVDAGAEVIFPDPGFVSYSPLTRLAGGVPISVGLRADQTLAPEMVERAITDRTAAFVVNSPGNPTGAVQDECDMRAFARIADEHDICCISDELYEQILFDGTHRSPMEFAESDNVILINSCSKGYAMTGWRVGWIVASDRRIERLLRVHQYIQACASAPAQYAAIAALTGPQMFVETMAATFEQRRDVLLDGLVDIGLEAPTPRGAFYVLPNVPDGWVDAILDRDVIIVPGKTFGDGGQGRARISYTASVETIKKALERMDAAVQAVQ
jgi:aspartate aminotransferase